VLFQGITLLDAGSVIPDLIRDRHDGQKLSAFLNYDAICGGQADPLLYEPEAIKGEGDY